MKSMNQTNSFTKNHLEHRLDGLERGRASDAIPTALKGDFLSTCRSYLPTGYILQGGTALKIGNETKKRLLQQGCNAPFRFLLFDTDPNEIDGTCFNIKEFHRVTMDRVPILAANPATHPLSARRLDPSINLTKAEGQAGQNRSYGMSALHSDHFSISAALEGLIRELTGAHIEMEHQRVHGHEVEIQKRIRLNVLASACGGTGSGFTPDMLGIIHSLTQGIDCEVNLYFVGASAFEVALQGSSEQLKRIRSNEFALFKELNAIQVGALQRHGIPLGGDADNPIFIPANFCNRIVLANRKTADGCDQMSLEAVATSIAIFLVAELANELGNEIERNERNNATMSSNQRDAQTLLRRMLGTVNARCLEFDTAAIARNFSEQALADFVGQTTYGNSLSKGDVANDVELFVSAPCGDSSVSLTHASVRRRIQAAMPKGPSANNALFNGLKQGGLIHANNIDFRARLTDLFANIDRTLLPRARSQAERCEQSIAQPSNQAVQAKCAELTTAHGVESARQFTEALSKQLESARKQCRKDGAAALSQAESIRTSINQQASRLPRRRIIAATSKEKQRSIASNLDKITELQLSAVAANTAEAVFASLLSTANQLSRDAQQACAEAEKVIAEAKRQSARTTRKDCVATLSVLPPGGEQVFYDSFYPKFDQFGPTTNRAEWQLKLASSSESQKALKAKLYEHFSNHLATIQAGDLIAEQLTGNNPKIRSEAEAKFKQLLVGTQPAWQAESGNNNLQFHDTILIGVPVSSDRNMEIIQREVAKHNHAVNPNGQYQSVPKVVRISTPHTIFCTRLTSGAAWHYLPEVQRCHRAYKSWNKSGGHSVHTFGPSDVAKMPDLIPAPKAKPAEMALAVGLCYGWIALRGTKYYSNLLTEEDGTYHVPLSSHWPTCDNGSKPASVVMPALVEKHRFVLGDSDDLDESCFIADTLKGAATALEEIPKLANLILEAFGELHAHVGDVPLKEELEAFAVKLAVTSKKFAPDATTYSTLIDALRQKQAELEQD